jgi:hypothetical protein
VRLSAARSGAAALAACLAHPTRGHTGFAKLMVWSFLVGVPERPGPDTLSRFVEQGTAKSGAEACRTRPTLGVAAQLVGQALAERRGASPPGIRAPLGIESMGYAL